RAAGLRARRRHLPRARRQHLDCHGPAADQHRNLDCAPLSPGPADRARRAPRYLALQRPGLRLRHRLGRLLRRGIPQPNHTQLSEVSMPDTFDPVWAVDGTVETPTEAEIRAGFVCGPANPGRFNWLFQTMM